MSAGPSTTWEIEQVAAVAPSASAFAAAQPLAVPTRWSGTGADQRAVWGRCIGRSAEPYDVRVDHVAVRFACTCASRQAPCKHAVALLLLWARGAVPQSARPAPVEQWIAHTSATSEPPPEPTPARHDSAPDTPPPVAPRHEPPSADRDQRVERMRAGLTDLRRWLEDRLRGGLNDPALARFDTWDQLAARLVDAQVGGLANRVRRVAGLAGAGADWHERVLSEFGLLGLLAEAGLRLPALPADLADSVAVTLGWQVRQASVREGVPDTDRWYVLGRSDTREDRIEVRRFWLRGRDTGEWAMLLSFAAYGQALDERLTVGSTIDGDLYRYPGRVRLRALLDERVSGPVPLYDPPPWSSVAAAAGEVGRMLAAEPWLDRVPCTVLATAAPSRGRWWLLDDTGMLPVDASGEAVALLAASTAGCTWPITGEWTAGGFVPLTVHLADRHVDLGRVADATFARSG